MKKTAFADVLVSHLSDLPVHDAHVRHEEGLYIVGAVHGKLRHESVGNSDQRLFGPRQEPVDRRPRN